MTLTALILATCLSTAVPPLVQQERVNRTREAQQALTAGDFERAEKLALAVMQGAEKNVPPRAAWKIYAECRFRAKGYEEAIKYFEMSVRSYSDGRVSAMLSVSALSLGDRAGTRFLGRLGNREFVAKKLKVDPDSMPFLHGSQGTAKEQLAYSWLTLASFEKGPIALTDANEAAALSPDNFAIDLVQGNLLFELGRYKEAKAEFERVVKSKFETMSEAAKSRVAACEAKIKSGGTARVSLR